MRSGCVAANQWQLGTPGVGQALAIPGRPEPGCPLEDEDRIASRVPAFNKVLPQPPRVHLERRDERATGSYELAAVAVTAKNREYETRRTDVAGFQLGSSDLGLKVREAGDHLHCDPQITGDQQHIDRAEVAGRRHRCFQAYLPSVAEAGDEPGNIPRLAGIPYTEPRGVELHGEPQPDRSGVRCELLGTDSTGAAALSARYLRARDADRGTDVLLPRAERAAGMQQLRGKILGSAIPGPARIDDRSRSV